MKVARRSPGNVHAHNLHMALTAAIATVGASMVEVGRLLHEVHETGAWAVTGAASWAEYLSLPEVAIEPSTDRKLRAMYRALCVEHGQTLPKSGWTKLYMVSQVLARKKHEDGCDCGEWMAKVEALGRRDLEYEVAAALGKDVEPPEDVAARRRAEGDEDGGGCVAGACPECGAEMVVVQFWRCSNLDCGHEVA